MQRGLFISFEGVEGTGKTTQARMLSDELEARGRKCKLTVEPGGTALSLKIRELLLDVVHDNMDSMTELLLYLAARRQHLAELVIPSIEAGVNVITDRFSDSTMAYQGYGRGIDRGLISRLDEMVTSEMRPDITILMDLDVSEGLRRNRGADKVDRLELESIEFHERVRKGFKAIAEAEPERIVTIDASAGIDEIHTRVLEVILKKIL